MPKHYVSAIRLQSLRNRVRPVVLFRSFVLLICLFCAFAAASVTKVGSQVALSPCKGDFFIDHPNFPARIGYMPLGAYYTLENHSDKRIIRYRLGCVVEADGKFKVVSRKKAQVTDLAPADASKNSVPFVYISLRRIKGTCVSKEAKAAIVEVTFSDGSVWNIQQ